MILGQSNLVKWEFESSDLHIRSHCCFHSKFLSHWLNLLTLIAMEGRHNFFKVTERRRGCFKAISVSHQALKFLHQKFVNLLICRPQLAMIEYKLCGNYISYLNTRNIGVIFFLVGILVGGLLRS